MRKVISMLKKQSKLVIGIFIGTILTTCIGYGVNSIQSSSVSYTKKDGTQVTVKQAIDDLIVKVNNKNLDIELDAGETLKLKADEENATWESSNEDVATVDSNGLVTAKSKGTAKITVKNDDVSSSVNVTVKKGYLADEVSVGDYVAYDAGGNTANSVAKCFEYVGTTTLKGWRVYSINKNNKTVTLIHAGQPECYSHWSDPNESVVNINNRANTYLNSDYADSAHMMTKAEADQNILRATGTTYWLATAYDSGSLWYVNDYGNFSNNNGYSGYSYGIRPLVVLKSNILTAGKGTDKVGQEAWTLVKP